jgi:hypothetical protein
MPLDFHQILWEKKLVDNEDQRIKSKLKYNCGSHPTK